MEKFSIPGRDITGDDKNVISKLEENDYLTLSQVVEVSSLRATADTIKLSAQEEDDIINIVFDDGGEWIGGYDDLPEIFGEQISPSRDGSGSTELPSSISAGPERGLGSVIIKFIGIFGGKKPAELVAEKIGEKFDQKAMPSPGLFSLTPDFLLKPFKQAVGDNQNYLLFIHGTASSTAGSFAQLKESDQTGLWPEIFQKYSDRVLTLQHKTVSVSPLQNAIDIFTHLPKGSILDVVSHSRGGIVADILSRCDRRNSILGFSEQEIDRLGKDDPEEAKLLQVLNHLAAEKSIEVHQTIRVACPAMGTTLLSERLDHYLNALLRAIGLGVGWQGNRLYQLVRSFIMDVIKSRATAGVMPGLNAMVPGSPLQNIINNPSISVKNRLSVIEGNAEFGGSVKHSIAVVLTNLFYFEANDFVVPTSSMRYGVIRESGTNVFLSKDKETSHFNYFKNKNSQSAIYEALTQSDGTSLASFTHLAPAGERGVALDFINLGEEKRNNISGNKPIVILVPGIMGSNLSVRGSKIWADFGEIGKGRIRRDLAVDAVEVTAESIIGKYYSAFVDELIKTFDAFVFPYDWRLSVDEAGRELAKLIEKLIKSHDQPIKIVAHSMGGLVVRNVMLDHPAVWQSYIKQAESKFLMLGTPWLGSYLIMEVITGHSRRVKQLALLDTSNRKRELMDVFSQYPGIFELLPVDDRAIESDQFWDDLIRKDLKLDKPEKAGFKKPGAQMLKNFKTYKTRISLAKFNFENTIYIAGKSNGTTYDYTIKKSLFGRRIKYLKTAAGDGSVTWDTGIPVDFPNENLYYTSTGHGDLANDPKLFPGIIEILQKGSTRHFQQTPPATHGWRGYDPEGSDLVSNNLVEASDILFGSDPARPGIDSSIDEIEVEVTHADLRVAKYPIMVGHFEQEGIVSAENALDKRINGRLTERHQLTRYAGDIGENEIIILPHERVKGAIVVGLGDSTNLTAFNLQKTIAYAVVEYALQVRDHFSDEEKHQLGNGLSSLCIGSNYANLPMQIALSAILNGVNQANQSLKTLGQGIRLIEKVEFVELYEDVAHNAYYSLSKIKTQESRHLRISLKPGIQKKYGGIKKKVFAKEDYWWHDFTTEIIESEENQKKNQKLRFRSSSGMARIEQENLYTSKAIVSNLLGQLSKKPDWDSIYAKTLFEILIPNAFKDIIRNQNNILWKLDMETATYPWEMFQDTDYDLKPTFVGAGLIRQLATETYRPNPQITRNKTALVIGDPIYQGTNLPQLPAAKIEAQNIVMKLEANDFLVKDHGLIGRNGLDILTTVMTQRYKILHIAAHGVFDPDNDDIGVVLGDGMRLSPNVYKNSSKVPEFAFINCCYSGTMDSAFERYYQDRYKFAANLGTELIQMGVNAVVVTGWAVHDAAAALFANTLYDHLLDGGEFGPSVLAARSVCYEAYPKTNTWGAYQCYGDPWYRLVEKQGQSNASVEYLSEEQVLIDLSNLEEWIRDQKTLNVEGIVENLRDIINRAEKAGKAGGLVRQKEAEIYALVDDLDLSIERYRDLLELNDASYSVKALEQYCNLRAKRLGRVGKATEIEIEKLKQDLQAMLFIGKTPERMSILGSAHKRMAQVVSDGTQRKEHLQHMRSYYAEAYELQKSTMGKAVYPLSNWVTSEILLNNRSITLNSRSVKIADKLKRMEQDLNKYKSLEADFWEDINLVNIKMCQLLLAKTSEAITRLQEEIVDLYQKAWQQGGAPKDVNTEIEHIHFLEAIWKGRGGIIKSRLRALRMIKEKLVELLG